MMIKFLPVGKGDPAGAAAYVVSDVDHLNIKRAGVKVLRGDPQIFAALAKSSEHKNCYTSAVVAWHLDDAPTDEDINEVLNEFEQHAFAGLEAQQYHMTDDKAVPLFLFCGSYGEKSHAAPDAGRSCSPSLGLP